jgi:hypothetical protein
MRERSAKCRVIGELILACLGGLILSPQTKSAVLAAYPASVKRATGTR